MVVSVWPSDEEEVMGNGWKGWKHSVEMYCRHNTDVLLNVDLIWSDCDIPLNVKYLEAVCNRDTLAEKF